MTKPFLALAFALTAATPALATPAAVRVSYADLDLDKAADMKRLDARVARAIAKVCGSYAEVSQEDWTGIKTCRANTAATVPQQIAGARAARTASRAFRVVAAK